MIAIDAVARATGAGVPPLAAWLGELLAGLDPGARNPDALRRLARRLVEAAEAGDVALDPRESARWVAELGATAVVGDAAAAMAATPVPVVHDLGRLYLHRAWEEECRVAEWVRARSAAPSAEEVAAWVPVLDRLFGPGGDPREALQRRAAELALAAPLALVTGGPGTGKTTTVTRVLAALAWRALEAGRPVPRVALAAPTGKAAQRLQEAIRAGLGRLELPDEVRAAVPVEATTLHRLLGMRDDGTFRGGEGRLAGVELVVVDEASMVDQRLFAALAAAMGPATRLVLLGDAGQLAPVEPGAVFAALVAAARRGGAPARAWVELEGAFRFGEGLASVLEPLRAGDADAFLAACRAPGSGVTLEPPPAGAALGAALAAGEAVAAFRRLVATPAADAGAFAALGEARLLVPFHDGALGRRALTAEVVALVGAAARRRGPLIITRNHAGLGLANGDVGLRDPEAPGQVVFPEGAAGFRSLPESRLPPHEEAWVLTVHRSQGSEFGHVHLVLPPADHPLLTRELLVTALSRARRSVLLWATEPVLRAALARVTRRSGGLADRLAGSP